MSMTKAGANYARHMDEVFAEDDRDFDIEYREYLYLQTVTKPPTTQTTKDNVDQRTDRKERI